MEVIIGGGYYWKWLVVARRTINREINLLSQIKNLVDDTKIIAQVIKNISFLYFSRLANKLVDMLAKKAHLYCI